MKKQAKKGFTIVELVIVIALIAILAAVLIPTFSNVINNAHESSDTMMVKNLNTILNTEEINGNGAKTMQDAIDQAEAGGYKVDKLTPTSSGDIVWDQESNRFLLINAKKQVVFKDDSVTGDIDLEKDAYKLWKITHNAANEKTAYSLYLAKNYNGSDLADLTVTAGVDVGEHKNVAAISYTGTDVARKIIFRTNGGTLTVDGAKDTVNHYGASDYTDIKAVDVASYHEHGVAAYVRIAAGHYVAESTAKVINLNVAASSVTVSESAGAKVVTYSKASNDVTVTVNGATKEVTEVKSEADIVKEAANSAVVAEDGVAEIDGVQYKTLQAAFDSARNNDVIVLNKDIDLALTVVLNRDITITLDMNGKTLKNTTDLWVGDNWSMISVRSGALTITGNGALRAKENDCYVVDIQDGAKCTIENGEFVGNIHAVYVIEGELTVNGGTFSVQQKYPDSTKANEFVLNCKDEYHTNGTAKITVTGGAFCEFNPANCVAEGAGTNFVKDGYSVVEEERSVSGATYTYYIVKAK